MRAFAMSLAALAMTGCAIGPAYTPPQMALPDRYARLEPVSQASVSDMKWWNHFNDPLMTQLVDTAVAGNLDLETARARVAEAQANARRDGNLASGDANLTRTSTNSADTSSQSLGVSASIGLAGQQRARAAAAAQRLEAARFDTQSACRALSAEVGVAYVDLRFAQASLITRRQDLRSRSRTLEDIRVLLGVGSATQLDLLRAQTLVSETRAQIPALAADVMRQRNRISTLLGRPVGSLPVDLVYNGAQPAPAMQAVGGVPADLLRARPDIRQAERAYAAALSDVAAAKAARYPSLSLRGVITAPLGGGADSESLAAGLVMPIFNQPALAASVDAAEARVDIAYLAWQRAVLSAIEEVENAQADLHASNAVKNETARLVGLNRRALDLSRELLSDRGAITVLDLLDRERALADARARLAQSQRDQAVDYIVLQTVVGIGHAIDCTQGVGAATAQINEM